MKLPARHILAACALSFVSSISHASIGADQFDETTTPAITSINQGNQVKGVTVPENAIPPDLRLVLEPLSDVNSARVTFYDPDINNAMEGGGLDLFSERINSVEDSIKNGRPITLAADKYGKFGSACNREDQRCLMLIHTKGFDRTFPGYRQKFKYLPKDTFLGIIEDTGGAFAGKAGTRMDIAVRNRSLARAVPGGFNDHVRWTHVDNPCVNGAKGRQCDMSLSSLGPTAVALLNSSNSL